MIGESELVRIDQQLPLEIARPQQKQVDLRKQLSAKAAGAVIDDAAVTPKYVQGFEAKRELPIIGKITTP